MLHYWYTNDTLMIQHWYTTDTLTDTLLAHYWHTTDTLLTHYLYTTEPVLAQHWHQYCSSIETVLPLYGSSADSPPGNWHPELFFGTHFLSLPLRQIMYIFWNFVFLLCFPLWHGGGQCPLPFPLPPEQSAGCPGAKPALLLRGEGEWEGASLS